MHSVENVIRLLICLTKLTKTFNSRSAYYLLLTYYILVKSEMLLKTQLKLYCIPDEIFSFLLTKYEKFGESCVDANLYILCNSKAVEKSKNWFHLCCKTSRKRYKVAVVSTDDVADNNIYISESMKFNVNRLLDLEKSNDPSYFLSKFFFQRYVSR